MRRVVVTGMGTVNPIGLNVDEYWEGLKAGKTGFGEITYFDTTDFKVKVAAEVKGFVAADRMDKKAARRMEPFAQYAVAAAKEAFEDAGLDMEKEDPYRVGWEPSSRSSVTNISCGSKISSSLFTLFGLLILIVLFFSIYSYIGLYPIKYYKYKNLQYKSQFFFPFFC